MEVGYAPVFQNLDDKMSDRDVYREELRLCDMAEPLGFDSIWEPEHHFTNYEMTPDVLQFLTYMAGRTTRVKLGSMVVVLPWHDPVRVAEQISLLDHFSNGRAILGMGRGLGAVEFDGFRLDMTQSRQQFTEYAEAIVNALATGKIEFDGELYKQPPRYLRPAPFKSFEGRLYGAGLSPETGPLLARLGLGMMIIPLKAWQEVEENLRQYNVLWADQRGGSAPPCAAVGFTIVHHDAEKAREMAYKYIGRYFESIIDHYDLAGDRIKGTKGYEYYSTTVDAEQDKQNETIRNFVELMPWGTPEQVIDKIRMINRHTRNGTYIAHFAFGGMPFAEAEESMRLFASEVMPTLQEMPVTSFEVEPVGA